MLKFSLGPGIFHDRFCSDWEFLAEVPAHGIGKKLVPFFLPSSASLDRFVLLDSFAEVCNQMGGAQTQRWLVLPPKGAGGLRPMGCSSRKPSQPPPTGQRR